MTRPDPDNELRSAGRPGRDADLRDGLSRGDGGSRGDGSAADGALRTSIEEELRSILVAEFELAPEQITSSARLVEDLDLDSIDGVTIVVRLESRLAVVITDEEIQRMQTVGDIVDALAARLERP